MFLFPRKMFLFPRKIFSFLERVGFLFTGKIQRIKRVRSGSVISAFHTKMFFIIVRGRKEREAVIAARPLLSPVANRQ